jgi:hypothetical protein
MTDEFDSARLDEIEARFDALMEYFQAELKRIQAMNKQARRDLEAWVNENRARRFGAALIALSFTEC